MRSLLDQLDQRCRHQPKMNGNREQITVTCSLLHRLIGLAEIAHVATDHLTEGNMANSIAMEINREYGYLDGEITWMKQVQSELPERTAK